MKRFKLQSVLDYRQILENQAQQRLAESLDAEAALIVAIEAEEKELQNLYVDLAKRQQEGISLHDLTLYENRISHKIEQLALYADQLAELRQEIERRRHALKEACQEKKLMEKLKEKHEEAEMLQLRRQENALLDEVAVLFHGR
jgi:flagellar FliJ protein